MKNEIVTANNNTTDAYGRNIVLIGMPGVGKSTIGVLLAKYLSRTFLDTDVYIQASLGAHLQDIINTQGLEAFRKIEEEQVCSIDIQNAVIATGGSVVYSNKAMRKLKDNSIIILLDLPIEEIVTRVHNLDSRGLVMEKGKTLHDLYRERMPIYQKYADIIVDCTGLNHDACVMKIITALE